MKMKKTSLNTTKVTDRKIKRLYLVAATVVAAAFVMAMPAFADDPLTTINNLSDFVFSAIKAIGAILLGFGIVQIGLALKGHDASQRAQGFMTFFGGVVIYFAKDILDKAVENYKASHKDVQVKNIELYIVPEKNTAYYVVNGEEAEENQIQL